MDELNVYRSNYGGIQMGNVKQIADVFEETLLLQYGKYEYGRVAKGQTLEYGLSRLPFKAVTTSVNLEAFLIERNEVTFEVLIMGNLLKSTKIWVYKRSGNLANAFFKNVPDVFEWMEEEYLKDMNEILKED